MTASGTRTVARVLDDHVGDLRPLRAAYRRRAGAGDAVPVERTGAPGWLLDAALDHRVAILTGRPRLERAAVGAALLLPLAPGPVTRATLESTVASLLADHAARRRFATPGSLLPGEVERELLSDCVALALLAQPAGADAPTSCVLAGPARAGLTRARLDAAVDPGAVRELTEMVVRVRDTLLRPLVGPAPDLRSEPDGLPRPSPLAPLDDPAVDAPGVGVHQLGRTLVWITTDHRRRLPVAPVRDLVARALLHDDVDAVAVHGARRGVTVRVGLDRLCRSAGTHPQQAREAVRRAVESAGERG
ncbi:MAG: hypothetical protein ACLGIR_02695 [Actinomycetes bacterium]